MIDILQGLSQLPPPSQTLRRRANAPMSSFEDLLRQADKPAPQEPSTAASGELRFSKHARARLESRGVDLDPAQLGRLGDSVDKLAAKGANESLVLLDDHAFIVGVPKRTVITAMSRNEAMGNVFTNLDSVLLAA